MAPFLPLTEASIDLLPVRPPPDPSSGSCETPSPHSLRPSPKLAVLASVTTWSELPPVPHVDDRNGLRTGLQGSTLASPLYPPHSTVVGQLSYNRVWQLALPLGPSQGPSHGAQGQAALRMALRSSKPRESADLLCSGLFPSRCFSHAPDLANTARVASGPQATQPKTELGCKPRPPGFRA